MKALGEIPTVFVLEVAGSIVIFWVVWLKAGPHLRRLFRFLDAWEGYEAPDGKHVPGVLERLARVEETAETAASAASAANGRLDHLSAQVAEVDRKVDEVAVRQDTLAAEQTQIRAAVENLGHSGTDATDPA